MAFFKKEKREKNSERFSFEEAQQGRTARSRRGALEYLDNSRLVVTHSVEEAPSPPMLSNPRPAADFGSEASETGRCISHNNRAPGFEFGYVDARAARFDPTSSHPHIRAAAYVPAECARAYNHEKLRLDFIWTWPTTPHLLLLFSSISLR